MSSDDGDGLQFLAENSLDVICRAGRDMELRYVSGSSLHVLGWKPEEMVGKRADAFVFSEGDSGPAANAPTGSDTSVATVRMRKKDGLIAWIEVRRRAVHDASSGAFQENIIVMRDVTERKALEARISELALTDAPTGLFTPRALEDALEREWSRTQREGSRVSLLLLHFNGFQQFHDWQAHLEGDACLASAAAAIIRILRATDFAARFGTEDIAILLPATTPRGAIKVARKIRSALEPLRCAVKPMAVGHARNIVTVGMATVVARSAGTAKIPEMLLLAASFALQRAKQQEMLSLGPKNGSGPSEQIAWNPTASLPFGD